MTFRHTVRRRAQILGIGLWSITGLTGCGADSSSATSPTTVATLATESFGGSIGQNGSAVHTFTVTSSGYSVLVGFTSLSPSSVAALGMGIGSWDSATSTCGLNVTQNDTARSGSTGLTGTASTGTYCLRVYDGGNVPAGVSAQYAVQVQHY